MTECLEMTAGKVTFRVPGDRLYTPEGVWAFLEKDQPPDWVRVGLTDYLQQRSGDVAFAFVKPAGTRLLADETLAEVETIKTLVEVGSPVPGTVAETNPALDLRPETINQDPYGEGWLAAIAASNWERDCARLLGPSDYLALMRRQVEEELATP